MEKESWLDPIDKVEDIKEIVLGGYNLDQYFECGIHSRTDDKVGSQKYISLDSYGIHVWVGYTDYPQNVDFPKRETLYESKYMMPRLGAFGPLRLNEEGFYVNDFDTLICEVAQKSPLAALYIEWLKFVKNKNKGRTIDGKTFSQNFAVCMIEHYVDSRINELETLKRSVKEEFDKLNEYTRATEKLVKAISPKSYRKADFVDFYDGLSFIMDDEKCEPTIDNANGRNK